MNWSWDIDFWLAGIRLAAVHTALCDKDQTIQYNNILYEMIFP